MTRKKVVVTGMGCVVPHGDDVEKVYQRVIRGESVIGRIRKFDPAGFATQIGSEVLYPVDAPREVGPYEINNEALLYTLGAADRALKQAGIEPATGVAQGRRGVVLATGVGPANIDYLGPIALRLFGADQDPYTADLARFYSYAPDQPEAQGLDEFHLDTAAPACAVLLGASRVWNTDSACASGGHAVADGAQLIARGELDVALVGGTCTPVTRVLVPGFAMLQALSSRNDDPEHASRPFDLGREGFVMGGGAAMLVLESEEHARARGATIYAEVVGWGYSCDSYRLTDPHPEGIGMALCMNRALASAGIGPDDVDYINAHGTSTPYNDAAETVAIKKALGERAYRIPVSSNKSMFGHLIHTAGALEGILSIYTIRNGVIPPTINYTTPDPRCDLDYVPNIAREADVRYVMKNSFGFGGQNICIVYKRFEG